MDALIRLCGKEVRIRGRLLRVARLEADGYQFLDDPQEFLKGLLKCGHRIDLFTFCQRVTETVRKYDYPMEIDNFAAMRITTFENWVTNQIRWEARNRSRQAEKKGVTLQV